MNNKLISLIVICWTLLSACTHSSTNNLTPPSVQNSNQHNREAIRILAASSLHKSFSDIEQVFESTHPHIDIQLEFQGSQDLVSALREGAPADVLVTADDRTMGKAQEAGYVDTPQVFATNTLALIVPRGNPAQITGLDASLEGTRLVICAKEVPCGNATARLADHLNVHLKPVSEEQQVVDVSGKVISGEADAGVVYQTDAIASREYVEIIPVKGLENIENTYLVARVHSSTHTQLADQFIQWVQQEQGQELLAKYGFGKSGT